MSAIDPSLLFHQQQQQQQQEQQRRAQDRTAVNGQTGNAVGSTSKDGDVDDNDASESEMQMDENAARGSRLNGDSEMQQDEDLAGDELDDESEPLDLKDDAVLAAFLAKMDDYEPILPNPVTRYYLERAGFQSADDRVSVKLDRHYLGSSLMLAEHMQDQAARPRSPEVCQRHCYRRLRVRPHKNDDRARSRTWIWQCKRADRHEAEGTLLENDSQLWFADR